MNFDAELLSYVMRYVAAYRIGNRSRFPVIGLRLKKQRIEINIQDA